MLRLSILHILSSKTVAMEPVERQLIEKLLQAEQIPLDVQGARERSLLITRLPQHFKEGKNAASRLAINWLISQFKVGLRPIWSPAATTIGALSERYGDIIWTALLNELQQTIQPADDDQTPAWFSEIRMDNEDLDDIREDERSWRDPSAHKVRATVKAWSCSPEGNWEKKRVHIITTHFALSQVHLFLNRLRTLFLKTALTVKITNCSF